MNKIAKCRNKIIDESMIMTQANSKKNNLTGFFKKKYNLEEAKTEFENLLDDKNVALENMDYLDVDEFYINISSAFSSSISFED